MAWFKHRHWWRPKIPVAQITLQGDGEKPSGVMTVEECTCGAVRTIELYAGRDPAVRITEAEQ